MIAPERWYEHQKNYQKYGFDMKPQPEPGQRKTRTRTVRKVTLPAGDRKKVALSMVFAIGMVMIMLIIITAYSANLRYDINSMIKKNNVITGEIENLEAKLYSTNNINYIEQTAAAQLGMVYPEAKDKVYISMDDMPEEGFSDVLKEKAYN